MKRTGKVVVERLYDGTEIKSVPLPQGDLRCPVCGSTELEVNVPFVCYLPTSHDCQVCGTSCVIDGETLLYIEGKKQKRSRTGVAQQRRKA
jgi:hypothetical protein